GDMDLQTRNFETNVWMQMEMKLFYCVGIPKMVFQNNGIIRKEEAATMLHAVAFISIMTGDEFRVGIGDQFYLRPLCHAKAAPYIRLVPAVHHYGIMRGGRPFDITPRADLIGGGSLF